MENLYRENDGNCIHRGETVRRTIRPILGRTNNNFIDLTKVHDVRVDFLNRCDLHYIQLSLRYTSSISRFVQRGTSSSRYLYFHLFSRSFIFRIRVGRNFQERRAINHRCWLHVHALFLCDFHRVSQFNYHASSMAQWKNEVEKVEKRKNEVGIFFLHCYRVSILYRLGVYFESF